MLEALAIVVAVIVLLPFAGIAWQALGTGAVLEVIADLGRPPATRFGQPIRPMIH